MVKVTYKTYPPSDESLPWIVLQITQLQDSYMIWAGTSETDPTDPTVAVSAGTLCRDWACAMPPKYANQPGPATSLFRTSSSDHAFTIAQRLAQRFKKQMFLSVDIPPTFLAPGQGVRLVVDMEKSILAALREVESETI